jgi:hypothetical protein
MTAETNVRFIPEMPPLAEPIDPAEDLVIVYNVSGDEGQRTTGSKGNRLLELVYNYSPEVVSGQIELPEEKPYMLDIFLPYVGMVMHLAISMKTGTAQAALKVGSNVVGQLDSVGVSQTPVMVQASGGNTTFQVGQTLSLELSDVSSDAEDCYFSVSLRRQAVIN